MINLKELREQSGLRPCEVARKMQCSTAYIAQLEKAINPKLPTIEAYLRACGYEVTTTIKLIKDGKEQEITL